MSLNSIKQAIAELAEVLPPVQITGKKLYVEDLLALDKVTHINQLKRIVDNLQKKFEASVLDENLLKGAENFLDWKLENEKLLEAVEVDFQNTIDEFASIERDEVEVLEAKLTLDQLSKSSVNSEKYLWFFEEVQKILKSV